MPMWRCDSKSLMLTLIGSRCKTNVAFVLAWAQVYDCSCAPALPLHRPNRVLTAGPQGQRSAFPHRIPCKLITRVRVKTKAT